MAALYTLFNLVAEEIFWMKPVRTGRSQALCVVSLRDMFHPEHEVCPQACLPIRSAASEVDSTSYSPSNERRTVDTEPDGGAGQPKIIGVRRERRLAIVANRPRARESIERSCPVNAIQSRRQRANLRFSFWPVQRPQRECRVNE